MIAKIVYYKPSFNDMVSTGNDWIQTYSGAKLFPLHPGVEDIWLLDIAHALSMLCRYNGHCLRFYSVAEHSVHIVRYLRKKGYSNSMLARALLHDAPEYALCDITKPVKNEIVGYDEIEHRLAATIMERFGCPDTYCHFPVKAADVAILADELTQNMSDPPAPWVYNTEKPLNIHLQYWSPLRAKYEFIKEFSRIFHWDYMALKYSPVRGDISRRAWLEDRVVGTRPIRFEDRIIGKLFGAPYDWIFVLFGR
jgi:hypothetical protein